MVLLQLQGSDGRKSLVKGDRVAFEVVSCNPGSKHSQAQNVVVVSDDGTPRASGPGPPRAGPAREQIDEETLPLLSVEDGRGRDFKERGAHRGCRPRAEPPNGEHERPAEAKGAVLRPMERISDSGITASAGW